MSWGCKGINPPKSLDSALAPTSSAADRSPAPAGGCRRVSESVACSAQSASLHVTADVSQHGAALHREPTASTNRRPAHTSTPAHPPLPQGCLRGRKASTQPLSAKSRPPKRLSLQMASTVVAPGGAGITYRTRLLCALCRHLRGGRTDRGRRGIQDLKRPGSERPPGNERPLGSERRRCSPRGRQQTIRDRGQQLEAWSRACP